MLLALSVVLGFGANLLRSEPLPLSGPLDEPGPPPPGAELPSLAAPDAVAAWENGRFLLDVRDPLDFEASRVAGAFPFPADDFENAYFDIVAGFDAEMPLLVYGAGADSLTVRQAAQYLIDRGHTDVVLAVCGVDGLLEAGADPGEGPAEELW